MRELISWLASHHFRGKQVDLCEALNMRAPYVSQYKTGKGTHGVMMLSELDKRHRFISDAISKAGLPHQIPAMAAPTDAVRAEASPTATASVPQPAAKSSGLTPAPQKAVLTANLSEIEGAQEGGQVHVMSLGVPVIDPRWQIDRPGGGAALHLRDGLRGRRAFAARRGSSMGGRSFEWWVEQLDARHDPAQHGSPLWVARELNGTLATLGQRIIGRWKNPSTGLHGGPSSPALLAEAIAAHCTSEVRINGLVFTGLLHPLIRELLDVAAEAAGLVEPVAPAKPISNFGARSGGLEGLKEGGSRLRELGDRAGIAFLEAMESVAPGNPEGAFAQLMKKPSFRNRFLAPEWRDGLSKDAVQAQMLRTPFVAEFVQAYPHLLHLPLLPRTPPPLAPLWHLAQPCHFWARSGRCTCRREASVPSVSCSRSARPTFLTT